MGTGAVVRVMVVGSAVLLAALPAGAQDSTSSSSSSSTVPETTTSVVDPPTQPPPPPPPEPPPPPAPPVGELEVPLPEGDPAFEEAEAGIRSQGPYASQPPFDPATANAVFAADLARARARLAAADRAISDAEAAVASARARLADLDGAIAPLEAKEREVVAATVDAHDDFTDAAVNAYIRGNDNDSALLISAEGATDYAVGKVLLDSALSRDKAAIDLYVELREGLDAELDRVSAELIDARRDVDRRQSALDWAHIEKIAAAFEVETWSAGSHAFVVGYTFPVDGAVTFGDSFGAPRMLGTPYEHWHEGTDIFAAAGTPLVAAEDGVLAGVKSGGVLGGNSLRIVGASGYTHYYAHLSAFAEGMEDGRPVVAGELVGFVGDTGNARGTSPHLHYEIQLPGGVSINPYPVLSVAHRWREQLAEPG